jgi:hypothetical protein
VSERTVAVINDARCVHAWTGMTEDEAWVMLDQAFPLPAQAWRDVMAQEPAVRDQLIGDMMALGQLSWTKRQSAWPTVLAGLTFLASLANPVSAIVGGVSGLISLAQLIK